MAGGDDGPDARPVDEVPDEVVVALRRICSSLPEVAEEQAWTGTRWRVRTKTFAHVLVVGPGASSAYAEASGTDVPIVVVTFASAGEELAVLAATGPPFFHAWVGRDVVGMALDEGTDWTEVAELLTESYCLLAPKKLAARVDRPEPGDLP